MDARIDVFAVLGLHLGEAHVIRNAGGRVTDDVLRSLALSSHVLGVEDVVVMQHTKCGLAGVTDREFQNLRPGPIWGSSRSTTMRPHSAKTSRCSRQRPTSTH